MPKIYKRVSDLAVKKATGKNWEDWIKFLDNKGAEAMTHKAIAKMLYDNGYITSSWWCQTVTVGYEYSKGKRTIGRSLTQGFEIGVQKILPFPKKEIWDLMTSPKGVKIWLGRGANPQFEKGFAFKTAEGTTGQIRVVVPDTKLRLTWHPKNWPKPSTLQIYLLGSDKNKTQLRFHQEKLPSVKWRQTMKEHWKGVTNKVEKILTQT